MFHWPLRTEQIKGNLRTTSRRLAEIHRHQAVHTKTRTMLTTVVPPGDRDWAARRFLGKTQKSQSNSTENGWKAYNSNQTTYNMVFTTKNTQRQLPLPRIPCYTHIWGVFKSKTPLFLAYTPVLVSHSNSSLQFVLVRPKFVVQYSPHCFRPLIPVIILSLSKLVHS